MSRRWKVALGVLGALALILAVNAVTTGNQTKNAGVTAADGQILELSRGAVQVTDSEPPSSPTEDPPGGARDTAGPVGQPIVLIHCYACSLHWFDRLAPLLAEEHRVIRIDLPGFGGAEKPESGYEIEAQAATVAEALNELEVEGALVAGNSMGAMVAASLAEQASELVDRAVVIDMAPNTSDFGGGLPILARLGYVPVLGEALWRISPDFAVRDSYGESFAPGFDMASGFEDPDQVLADYDAMTYTSFDSAPSAADDYVDELPLDERFTRTPVPLLVLFGSEDQIFDAQRALEGYADVPGVQTALIEGAGHAPQVEKPEEVAERIEGFAVDVEPPEPARPRAKGQRNRGRDRPQGRDGARGKGDGRATDNAKRRRGKRNR